MATDIVRPAWMTDDMYSEWLGYYLEAGGNGVADSDVRATEQFRQSKNYERYFPGIKRDDGAVRYTNNPEQTYYANMEAFKNSVEGVGLNPSIFGEEFIDLIMGDVSPNEFSQRVSALESRVMSQGPAIRDWYAANLGVDFTREGILASLMSKRIDDAVLSKQITMAEIGGESVSRGFDLSREFVNMLANEGMNREEADRLFGSAERMLPALAAMAARNADTKDPFDIKEFVGGEYLLDADAGARIDRLKAQESSEFTGGGGQDFARSRTTGGVSGLVDV